MKKRLTLFLLMILYITGAAFTTAAPTYAEEASSQTETGSGNPLGFAYKVIQPENQLNKEVGYFDLRMTPGQEQTVQIELSNASEEEVEVIVALNGAKTNSNGVIEYGPNTIDNDKSLKYDFADIVTGPESVVIPPNSTIPLELTIKMPDAGYDGVISGGIQLKKAVDEEARKQKSGVINEYAFMIGMLLTENDTPVEPNLEFNSVGPGLNNYRNSIYINLSNVEASYLENLTIEAQIMQSDSEAVLYDTKKANMRVAPNSMIDFAVSMNGEKMVPGDYRAKILATAGDRSWSWDETFTITDEDADKYNKQDVELIQAEGINWVLVGMIAGGMLVVVLIIFIIVHLTRKKKEAKKKAQRKRKKAEKK